jgi:aminopeptidase N
MRCLLPVLGLLVACGDGGDATPDAGSFDAMPAPPGPVAFEVAHYDYRFNLETRGATSALTLEVTGSGDCLSLPMRAYPDSVTVEGSVLRSTDRVDDVLTVCSDLGWLAGSEITLTTRHIIPLATWNNTQVGYSVETDVENQPFHYLVSWVGGCDRFGPCDNRPDRFATYRFTVTHPEGTTVLCPGVVTAGATETTCAFDHAGGPTYSTFGVAASPSWEPISLGTWGSVEVTLYDTPSSGIAAAFDADQHADFLAFMETTFGPYPYGHELRFAVGPTYWNGFEHPGNIVLYDGLEDQVSPYANPLAHTTNHELAHQWAGDQTTLADTYDFVWKEAMAEYLTFVFEEEQVAPSVGRATVSAWKSRGRFAAYFPVPTGEPRPTLLEYYGQVYSAGPMILFRQLEALYSRDAVIEALQSVLGSERALAVADLQAALEVATGADLQNYFDTWVYGAGDPTWPTYDVTITDRGAGTVEVTVSLAAGVTGTWGSAFAVSLTGDGPDDTHEVWFDLGPDGMTSHTVTATGVPFTVTGHVFDPHAHTLAREQAVTVAPIEGDPNLWIHD